MKDTREILAQKGLNIFAASPMGELSAEILNDFKNAGILWNENDHICVLGHGGRRMWDNLPKPVNESDNPVDNYAIEQVHQINHKILKDPGLRILFPGSYLIPLQKLGRFLNISRPSVLGLDINNEFGVWFAFRAVFITRANLTKHIPEDFLSPCETCTTKPCRTACAPKAVQTSQKDFNLTACASFRLKVDSPCLDRCLARMACPFKSEHQYSLEQQQYHMGRTAHLARLIHFSRQEIYSDNE